ncbi:M4 family metallopeptidase [Umboniibacter marinipuniceus]|uniref:FHA domain-containing protein n=1 Tax=Umboniibacter marinipuniceus TaxID=569599 RepID=A0A3M0A266_9GAMM|nr:M4 family metallopeptidase [Umboniibacter marinipuniceus]RMA78920.1 FHA domain-containing protein [Umboniibacter marinipuniceus]
MLIRLALVTALFCLSSLTVANQPVAHIFDYQRFCAQHKNRPSQDQWWRYLVALSGRIDGDIRVYRNHLEGNGDPLVMAISQNAQYYDAFRRLMGMDGVDGRGLRHNLLVNMNRGSNGEPFECGDGEVFDAMSVRQGNELSFDAFSKTTMALEEVVGHEAYHAFIGYNSALEYEFQSGALNEALADAFGVVFRQWLESGRPDNPADIQSRSNALWQLRDVGQPLRDMISPNNHDQPDHMNQYIKLPNTADGDWGGVHYNSGIINHAFFLLAEGGQHRRLGSGPTVSGIGPYKALTIWHSGAILMHPYSDFRDAREKFQRAAVELFGHGSGEVQSLVNALDAVGIAFVPLPQAPVTTPGPTEPEETIPPVNDPVTVPTPPETSADPVVIDTNPNPGPVVTNPAPTPGPVMANPEPEPTEGTEAKRWWLIGLLLVAGGALLWLSRRQPFAETASTVASPAWSSVQQASRKADSDNASAGTSKDFKIHIDGAKLYLDPALLRTKDGQVFGRSANFCHVVLANAAISRRHLRVCLVDKALWVTDLNSQAGVMVNGQSIPPMQPVRWEIGDTLSVANRVKLERKS